MGGGGGHLEVGEGGGGACEETGLWGTFLKHKGVKDGPMVIEL